MANRYYECHVTMLGDPAVIRPEVEKRKWKFSAIDGDVNLGDGIKCYATRQYNHKIGSTTILDYLWDMAHELTECGFTVLRRKVELVIYDDRSTKINCVGGCPECHLDDLCSK